jgi:acyl-CoA synthetase (AMP-forming)/AMP-acid ligase II
MRMIHRQTNSLIDLLRDRAAAQGDATAFTFLDSGEREGGALTWNALEARSRAIGAAIAARVPAGARVLIMLEPGVDFVPAFFGVLYAAAIAIPTYPPGATRADRSSVRLRGMIADAGVSLVLSSSTVRAQAAALQAMVPELAGLPWIDVDAVGEELAEAWRVPRCDHGTIGLLQYTSGSTAVPRGVVVTHGNLLDNLARGAAPANYNADSIAVSWLPVNHDMGLINGVLQPVFSGYAAYLMSPAAFLQRPARWLQAISRYGATHSGGPNFAYDLCTRRIGEEERSALDLSTWRVAYNGSEPVRGSTLEAFHRAFAGCGFAWTAMRPAYGLAESTLLVSSGPPDGPVFLETADGQRLVSSGVVEDAAAIRIVDPRSRRQIPDGLVGEIWVASPSVAQGYWNKPRESAAVFGAFTLDPCDGPYLRTGDLACIVNGQLFVTGRIKDVMIVRGVKHYPHDLETTVEQAHPGIRAGCCAAFAVQRDGVERVALIAEMDSRRVPAELDLQEVLASIRRCITEGHHVSPCAVALVPAGTLPKTTSGKLQRFLCRDLFLAGGFDLLASWIEPTTVDQGAEPAFVAQPFRAAVQRAAS